MRKKILSSSLIMILFCSALTLSGCGVVTTLNKIGPALTSLGSGFDNELLLLFQAKLIAEAKYNELVKLNVGGKAKAIGAYLTDLKAITTDNKAAVIAEVAKAIAQFQGLVGVIPQDTVIAKILTAITITLNSVSIALGFVPTASRPAAAASASANVSGTPTASIRIRLENIPKEALKYIPKDSLH